MNKNELNKFDELLKGKLDEMQPAFDPKSWERLEKQLPKTTPKTFYTNPWFLGGVAAVTIIALSVSFWPASAVDNNTYTKNKITELSPTPTPISNPENNLKETTVLPTEISNTENQEIKTSYEEAELVINQPIKTENKTDNTSSETEEVEDVVKELTEISETLPNETQNLDRESTNSTVNDVNEIEEEAAVIIHKPTSTYTVNLNESCLGATFKFNTVSQNEVDYLWNFGDGSYSKEMNPKHKYTESGSFIVNLIVRSKIDNSVLSKSSDQLIQVHASPEVNFTNELIDNQGIPKTSFINTTDKAVKWSWNFGDGNISKEKNPNHSFRKQGMYAVSLTATNDEGCSKTYTKKVIVNDDYNLLAPNSFTPNGDGLNDYFMPVALEILDVSFSMSIVSNTEGLIYETKNINDKWDGTNQQNGSQCTEGSYMWIVKLINSDGETEQYKGAILLLK